jgi:hypothetical protein
MPHVDLLGSPICIGMSQAGMYANLLELTLNPEAFARLPHCIIRYNLSGVVNRRLIGDDKMKLAAS